jgi:TonB family protein
MKCRPIFLISILSVSIFASAQSGRRSNKPPPAPSPSPTVEPSPEPAIKPNENESPQVEARPGEEYQCTNDGSLAVIVPGTETEPVFAAGEVNTKAKITSRPVAEYTREARRRSVEGVIAVRVALAANGKISSVKIVNRGLLYGLNNSAIHAACKIEFRPAIKDGKQVTQWLKVDYPFRLESSIFRRWREWAVSSKL